MSMSVHAMRRTKHGLSKSGVECERWTCLEDELNDRAEVGVEDLPNKHGPPSTNVVMFQLLLHRTIQVIQVIQILIQKNQMKIKYQQIDLKM